MPESPKNEGFEPASGETPADSLGADTQPEAGTETPEKAKEFNAEEFEAKIKTDFLIKPFTAKQVLASLGLDSSNDDIIRQAIFQLGEMGTSHAIKAKKFTYLDDQRISPDKLLVIYCANPEIDFKKISLDEFLKEAPVQTKQKAKTVQKKEITFETKYQTALDRINAALKGTNPNWRLYIDAGTSTQIGFSQMKENLGLNIKKDFADEVIEELLKKGILITTSRLNSQKINPSTLGLNATTKNSPLYSINFDAPYFLY